MSDEREPDWIERQFGTAFQELIQGQFYVSKKDGTLISPEEVYKLQESLVSFLNYSGYDYAGKLRLVEPGIV